MAAFIELALGEDSAVISPTGASLREYTVSGRAVVVPMNAFDGAVLAPWPNRIAEGRYEFNGQAQQLPITEPTRNTALHGLVADVEWDVADRSENSVILRTELAATEGYPHNICLTVSYVLGENGIAIDARAHNSGNGPAPFGFGFHPWFHPGAELVDEALLVIPSRSWLETDDRLIPTTARAFDDGSVIPPDHEREASSCIVCKDFRALRAVNDTVLDDAFAAPIRSEDGWSRARLRGGDGREVVIGMDESFRNWQVCTGDELPQGQPRRAIAIEPMTCAPNAFADGQDFDVIAAGEELSVAWTISLS